MLVQRMIATARTRKSEAQEVAHMKEGIAAAGVQVEGTFNVQRFFETLAMILSRKENLSITVTVHEEQEEPQRAAV